MGAKAALAFSNGKEGEENTGYLGFWEFRSETSRSLRFSAKTQAAIPGCAITWPPLSRSSLRTPYFHRGATFSQSQRVRVPEVRPILEHCPRPYCVLSF